MVNSRYTGSPPQLARRSAATSSTTFLATRVTDRKEEGPFVPRFLHWTSKQVLKLSRATPKLEREALRASQALPFIQHSLPLSGQPGIPHTRAGSEEITSRTLWPLVALWGHYKDSQVCN